MDNVVYSPVVLFVRLQLLTWVTLCHCGPSGLIIGLCIISTGYFGRHYRMCCIITGQGLLC